MLLILDFRVFWDLIDYKRYLNVKKILILFVRDCNRMGIWNFFVVWRVNVCLDKDVFVCFKFLYVRLNFVYVIIYLFYLKFSFKKLFILKNLIYRYFL